MMNTRTTIRTSALISFAYCTLLCTLLAAVTVYAQQPSAAQVQEAKRQLNTMTPEQIDAKIKEYGMTRDEAELKAKALGIDLESYLNKGLPPKPAQEGGTIQIQQGGATVEIKTGPSEPAAETTAEQPAVIQSQETESPKVRTSAEQSGAGLEYFGYSLFQSPAGAFEPRPFIDDQYILGEGDVVKISLSGELQSYNEYTVNAEGRIVVTGVPPVLVAGLTVERAKKAVMNALGNSYSGILRNPPTIFLDLAVARIRPVRIFVTGEVQTPGGYAVSNFGNVFNSLFSFGGPKVSGSLRDIRVIRNNKVVAKVDIYDYLFGSPKTNDLRVNDNDILFIPLRGKSVSIKGEVLRPFTFELLPGENLKKLIEFSGGVRSNIYLDRIQVDRIIPFEERVKGGDERKIFDLDAKEILAGKKDYTLEDGDVITIFPILDRKENFAEIAGDVRRPGRFQIDRIRTVKDLITAADGFWPTAYMARAELMREFPDQQRQMVVLDLNKVMANDPAHNVVLQKKDRLRIYNKYELNPAGNITVFGHVKRSGTVPFADSMTVKRLLLSLGGLEDSLFRARTFMDRGDLFRLNDDLVTRRRIQFSPADILGGAAQDLAVMSGDQIRIYGLDEVAFIDRSVEILGNVKRPGRYNLSDGMTLTDLLLLAGGYTLDAWSYQAEIARVNKTAQERDSILTITFAELPDLFDTTKAAISILSSKAGTFRLVDKDQVFIRPHPEYKPQQLVTVSGYVRFPGRYALTQRNERFTDIIRRAGGIDPEGYARGTKITRNGERMRNNLELALRDPGGDYDFILSEGDVIDVPKKPNTVRVTGEVNNPGVYMFVDGESMEYYLERAGEETDSADFALVTFPEGHVEKASLSWYSCDDPDIADGTVITVVKMLPEKPKTPDEEKRSTFVEVFKETTAIIATTFTILVLANQLK